MLQGIGVPAAGLTAWLVAIVECLGGLALIVGAFVTVAAVPLAVNMLVALFTVHLPMGFSFMNITEMSEVGPLFGMPGYEVNLLYIAGLVALILGGAGTHYGDVRSRPAFRDAWVRSQSLVYRRFGGSHPWRSGHTVN